MRGKCYNGGDMQIIGRRSDPLVADTRRCVRHNDGDERSVECMEDFGFTTPCAKCWVHLGNCAKSKCDAECKNNLQVLLAVHSEEVLW